MDDVDALWDEVARRGTPLVDPVPDTTDEVELTYPWRATDPSVTGVEMVGTPSPVLNETFARHPLTRVGDTDTWTARFRAPARTVHGYGYVELGPDRQPLNEAPRPDPHARRQHPGPDARLDVPPLPGEWTPTFSVTDLRPEAGPAATPAATGTVREHSFTSDLLGGTRRLWSYTPAGYDEGQPTWLVLLHDGWQWRSSTPVATILDDLVARGELPPTVVVMHECPEGRRGVELVGDERFADAMATELVPWARETWGLPADPARTVVAGQSYGGLNAAYLGLRHPDVFGHVVSQSGSYWHWREPSGEEWLTALVRSSPRVPVTFHVEVGLLEGAMMVEANRRLRDALADRGYEHAYRETAGDHGWIAWSRTLGDALRWVTRP